MSTLRVDNLQGQTAGTNRYVVQVVFGALDSDVNYSSTAVADIFSLSITPSSTSNKILIFGSMGHWKPMMTFLDSPATTSSITYKLVHDPHTYNSGGTFGKDVTSLTLMEIAQ